MTDILIIGAGVAGLTAAIYAQRAGFRTVVLDRGTYGGQAAITNEIENFPSREKITGFEFAVKLYQHAQNQGADIRFEEVLHAELSDRIKRITTSTETHEAKAVILANGVKRRLLNIPGEAAYSGRGVSYCATCDGAFFRGKHVAVVGGGNVALEEALFLSNLCKHVTMIHRRDCFTGEQPLIHAIEQKTNISVRFNTTIQQILGTEEAGYPAVSSILLQSGAQKEELPLSAVFVTIGYIPDNSLFRSEISLDNNGYLLAGEDCLTNQKGVYAAGDCRRKELRQIVTAAADGAMAAYQAGKLLLS